LTDLNNVEKLKLNLTHNNSIQLKELNFLSIITSDKLKYISILFRELYSSHDHVITPVTMLRAEILFQLYVNDSRILITPTITLTLQVFVIMYIIIRLS